MLNATEASRLAAARAGDPDEFSGLTEPYRRELQVHCYRMLGSLQDAEDLVQETMLRAWRRFDTFEGRASVRAWLYRIATNACLDALHKRPRRALPADSAPASDPGRPPESPVSEPVWLEPFPDDLLAAPEEDPEARYTARESVTLAFLTALQLLPPRQRAVLLMRDVLGWRASEVAGLLDLTIPAVNSALHRARVTLALHYHAGAGAQTAPKDDENLRALLERYVRAWEAADVPGLLSLLKEEAAFAMPPSPSWYRGRDAIRVFLSAAIFTDGSRGRWRRVLVSANSQPAFAVYERGAGGSYQAFAIEVLTMDRNQIADVTTFINPALFSRFGLPDRLAD